MTKRSLLHPHHLNLRRQNPALCLSRGFADPAVSAGFMIAAVLLLAGCQSQTTFRAVDLTPPERITEDIPDAHLLDVGIEVFDPNAPDSYDEAQQSTVNGEVRRAESYYMPYLLKTVMESTGNWGAVRVVPSATHAVDLLVSAAIVISQGERLVLDVQARDARGVQWLDKRYEALASKYGYGEVMPDRADPFQHLYTRVADDLAASYLEATGDDLRRIRRTAEMRFAESMVPVAFDDYVQATPDGMNQVTRLPAEDDPMMKKVRQVRQREFLFIDTLESHYSEYHRRVRPLYETWRQSAYNESMARLELGTKRRRQVMVGTISLLAGIVGGPATFTAIPAGAEMLKKSITQKDEMGLHTEALREVSSDMESEVMPHTIELENKTVELTGTVEEQYSRLRKILRDDYHRTLGLEPGDLAVSQPAATASAEP